MLRLRLRQEVGGWRREAKDEKERVLRSKRLCGGVAVQPRGQAKVEVKVEKEGVLRRLGIGARCCCAAVMVRWLLKADFLRELSSAGKKLGGRFEREVDQ